MSKVILITGTSSGFGRTIAEKLHSEGYTVIGTSRNAEKINSDYLTVKLDINNYDASKSEVDKIIKKHGKIDILVNNAGINITGPTETMKMDDVKRVFDTNFFSQLNLIQTVLPYMRSKKMGLIINITSIAGYLGLPFWSAYCASKASFRIIAESLNIELKKYNVNVVNIAPGDYKTEILNNRRDSDNPSYSPYFQEYKKIIKEKKPKINYLVGGFLEKKITLKSLLPDKLFQKIII